MKKETFTPLQPTNHRQHHLQCDWSRPHLGHRVGTESGDLGSRTYGVSLHVTHRVSPHVSANHGHIHGIILGSLHGETERGNLIDWLKNWSNYRLTDSKIC